MRGDHQHRFRTRQGARPGRQLRDPERIVDQWWCAMTDVKRRHATTTLDLLCALRNLGRCALGLYRRTRLLRLQFLVHYACLLTILWMAADHAVSAEGLVKHYGRVKALDGLDLYVDEGTLLAVLGPNGAGKTTAVRILTTLLKPDAGRATVAGFDVVRQADRLRSVIGLSGQYAAVDENLTGRENLWLFGRLYQLSAEDATRRAGELLDQFDLSDAADRPVKTYSGG